MEHDRIEAIKLSSFPGICGGLSDESNLLGQLLQILLGRGNVALLAVKALTTSWSLPPSN